jgi:hypothetical protein
MEEYLNMIPQAIRMADCLRQFVMALFHVIFVRLLRDKIRSALMTELSGYFTTEQLGGDTMATLTRQKRKHSKRKGGENTER